MAVITIDTDLLYTKAEYCRAYPQDYKTLEKKIDSKQVKTIKIKGSVLVVAQRG